MKKSILLIAIAMFSINFSIAQEKLPINIQKSTIKWIGEYTFYFGGHDGFINFKEGYFIKRNDVITGGTFIIDMNSITNTDIKEQKGKDGLVSHLKNEDFFEVEKYPTASLKITKVEYSDKVSARLEADLTLKGITKSINFRVKFDYKEKEMKTRFKIDRKRWNVNYESKFKDGAISDAIGFEVSVKL
ncbi:YceI family protein [Polaribacter aestuariivivens]|uniref:YceI family protein n=1 Tax=Polaribacter aestuariivivens TaxID=2304626 RepID=A0A5S3N3D2_9FLAO|nr:YceI family protein [Polaribacter aestuariivivens]TMM29821.1 YceI family protein [Polaribacter aestuariivivens]